MPRLTPLLYALYLAVGCGLSRIVVGSQSDHQLQIEDDCFDSIAPVYKNMSCGQLMNESSGYCYTVIKNFCCISCSTIHTGIKNCEYGDRSMDCDIDSCSKYDEDTRKDLCCQTCAKHHESEDSDSSTEEEEPTAAPVILLDSTPPVSSTTPTPTTVLPLTTQKAILEAPKPSTLPTLYKPVTSVETPDTPVFVSLSRQKIESKQQENIFRYERKPKQQEPLKHKDFELNTKNPEVQMDSYKSTKQFPIPEKVNENVENAIHIEPNIETFSSGPVLDWTEPNHVISDPAPNWTEPVVSKKYLTLSSPQMSLPNHLEKTVLSMPVFEELPPTKHGHDVPVNNHRHEPVPQHSEPLENHFQGDGSFQAEIFSPTEETMKQLSPDNEIASVVKDVEEKEDVDSATEIQLIDKKLSDIELKASNIEATQPLAPTDIYHIDHALPIDIESAIIGNVDAPIETNAKLPVAHQEYLDPSLDHIQDLGIVIIGLNGEITIENPSNFGKELKHEHTKEMLLNTVVDSNVEKSNTVSSLTSPLKTEPEVGVMESTIEKEETVDSTERASNIEESTASAKDALQTEEHVELPEIENPKDATQTSEEDVDNPDDDLGTSQPNEASVPAEPKSHYIIEEQRQPLTLQRIYPVEVPNNDGQIFVRERHNFKVITSKRRPVNNFVNSLSLPTSKTKYSKPRPIILNDIYLHSSPIKKPKPITLRESYLHNLPTISSNFGPSQSHTFSGLGSRPSQQLFIIQSFRRRQPSSHQQIRLSDRQTPQVLRADNSNILTQNLRTVPYPLTFSTTPFGFNNFQFSTLPYYYPIYNYLYAPVNFI